MTLFCLLSRPWLIPYVEGDARGAHDIFAASAWRHLNECPRCQAERVRLQETGSALQAVSRASRRTAVRDDLSSTLFAERVMTRVLRDEQTRRQQRLREQRRLTASLSLGFALAGLGFAFTIYGPPSLARTWFTTTFHTATKRHGRHVVAKKPPFAMHDPFSVAPMMRPDHSGVHVASWKKQDASHDHRPVSVAQPPIQVKPIVVIPASVPDPMAPSASVNDAREATIVAEESERERWEKARAIVVPSPNGARLAIGGPAAARTAALNAPPLLLANAQASPVGIRPMRAASPVFHAPPTAASDSGQPAATREKPASPDELRTLGLAPSMPPTNPPPAADLGAPSSGSAP